MQFQVRHLFIVTALAAVLFALRVIWVANRVPLLTIEVPAIVAAVTSIWLASTDCAARFIVGGALMAGIASCFVLSLEVLAGSHSTSYIWALHNRYSPSEHTLVSLITSAFASFLAGTIIGLPCRPLTRLIKSRLSTQSESANVE